MSNKPNVYIIAGPNGAGKTTFAREFLPQYVQCKNFINADFIAQGLSPFSPQAAGLRAGRLVLEQILNFSTRKMDFGFESTLSGKTYYSLLKQLKGRGYSLHLFFLWVPGVELSLARIKERVAKGGHDVPQADVRRRFRRSFSNFLKLYEPLFDSWYIFDNSTTAPNLVAQKENGRLKMINQELFLKLSRGNFKDEK